MEIHNSEFLGSFVSVDQCPPADRPEYALIGRSNVGKSSLLNMLTKRKSLARVSHTPGKTQTINHFLIDKAWYLVDLPGYGYAKISKTQRKNWERFIRQYLQKRENLQCVIHLVDSRIPPQKIDLEFANWMGDLFIPFVTVFTKIDDRKYQRGKFVKEFQDKMLERWNDLPHHFLTSSKSKSGREDILSFIDKTNAVFTPPKEIIK